jgi:hypothetical protein
MVQLKTLKDQAPKHARHFPAMTPCLLEKLGLVFVAHAGDDMDRYQLDIKT